MEIARAHHGSLAREERTKVEEMLKAGQLPCLVATSSLELGIDMGAVDLVVQIESPKSVARGLQRIGRAGHGVGEVSRGRIFPKFRGDLLECAVVARRMREGAIEPTVVPRNALDVLAQQVVAIAVSAEGGPDSDSIAVDELHALVTRTHSYSELSRELLENVLDMLDGRYPSKEFGELRARIVWDRLAGVIRGRKGSRQLAIANAGTIPDRGLYAVTLPDGRRVGELDEEMVYEARPGQVFLLGASTWRIEEITRDRVIVTPAPGAPGAVPFWKGDSVGRPKELGAAIGAFSRWAVEQDAPRRWSATTTSTPAPRATSWPTCASSRRRPACCPASRRSCWSASATRSATGACACSRPSAGACTPPGAWRSRRGCTSATAWSPMRSGRTTGSSCTCPTSTPRRPRSLPSAAELLLLEPEEVEQAVVSELGGSALFGAASARTPPARC